MDPASPLSPRSNSKFVDSGSLADDVSVSYIVRFFRLRLTPLRATALTMKWMGGIEELTNREVYYM